MVFAQRGRTRRIRRYSDMSAPSQIPANDYATSWSCPWTDTKNGALSARDIELLRHVNCSYLSSGTPPTLLSLKQHAQSLTKLISKLSVSSSFGLVDGRFGEGETSLKFRSDEAFDWLNNLGEPYENEDEAHNWPLWALANHVKGESEAHGPEYHCPLEEARDSGSLAEEDGTVRPYRTHQNLVMHANECLEILDHEYSATGGLLSLLPSDKSHDSEEMDGARNTLLGQWLLHHQHLVGRMHELEINYANALDLLAGEAVVPMQRLSDIGAQGRTDGRPFGYPQDRYILANVGDDVFEFLHREMDKAESDQGRKSAVWRACGVSGSRLWTDDPEQPLWGKPREDDGDEGESARGVVSVEYPSRFYRLKGHGHKSTIFVLPVSDQHPGTSATRDMEARPTVVSTVTPTWPARVSELEQRHRDKLGRLDETETINRVLLREKADREVALEAQRAETARNKAQLGHFMHWQMSEEEKRTDLARKFTARLTELRDALPREFRPLFEDLEVSGSGSK